MTTYLKYFLSAITTTYEESCIKFSNFDPTKNMLLIFIEKN